MTINLNGLEVFLAFCTFKLPPHGEILGVKVGKMGNMFRIWGKVSILIRDQRTQASYPLQKAEPMAI